MRYSTGFLGNRGDVPLVMSYQNVTGTLSPGGHPDSYNGQDAYNDMLVVEYDKTDFLHRGGVKPLKRWMPAITKDRVPETGRNVKLWQ